MLVESSLSLLDPLGGRGGGGGFNRKVTGALVRNFQSNPFSVEIPESCFVGMDDIHFHP